MRWPALVAMSVVFGCQSGPQPWRDPFEGGRWQIVVGRADVSLRGLCVVDEQVAWASGSRGTVLRSLDGGASWQSVGPAGTDALDFRDVAAFDRDRALVCSTQAPAQVFATENGGASWRIVFEDHRAEAFFDAMAFFADGRGLLFADPIGGRMQVFAATDAGRSWQPVPQVALPQPLAGEGGFAASGTCVAARGDAAAWIVTGGLHSRCLRSEDGGASWSSADLPVAAGTPSRGAFSIAFFDDRHGVVVGGDYEAQERTDGTAATTDDGGRSWRAVRGIGAGGYRSGVACLDDGRSCIAVGQGGVSVSVDGGATWRPFGSDGFHAVGGAGATLLAVGSAGRIGRLVREGR